MEIRNWIFEDNLEVVLKELSKVCKCNFTELDWQAFVVGIADDKHFTYTLIGDFSIDLDVFRESGESAFHLTISTPKSCAGAIEAILNMAQTYEIKPRQ